MVASASLRQVPAEKSVQSLHSFSKTWAQRYVRQVNDRRILESALYQAPLSRERLAEQMIQSLRPISARAWSKTEALLAKEIVNHQLSQDLIDPWAIAEDVYHVYVQALTSYAKALPSERFAIEIAQQLGRIRQKYTAVDPRVIAFVSMQFHYTGQLLLETLSSPHRARLQLFFKAIDDHLYMPLHRAYDAAANYDYRDMELQSVRCLLPESSRIAKQIVNQVHQAFHNHRCYSGPLNDLTVQAASIRDVEMFQAYLWVCILERNIHSVQQELFPLCVMLYPTLNVSWSMVRQMLTHLDSSIHRLLTPEQWQVCVPYLGAMHQIFSREVFDS
ncbi:MAG: hypothetical protein AAF215_10255 [Cyanobacteria bacterium P01_A01_bin.123]